MENIKQKLENIKKLNEKDLNDYTLSVEVRKELAEKMAETLINIKTTLIDSYNNLKEIDTIDALLNARSLYSIFSFYDEIFYSLGIRMYNDTISLFFGVKKHLGKLERFILTGIKEKEENENGTE